MKLVQKLVLSSFTGFLAQDLEPIIDTIIETTTEDIFNTPCVVGESEGCTSTAPATESTTTTTPDPNNACGSLQLQTGESGEFSSKNYPNPYPSGINCEWNIEVDNNSAIAVVVDENFYIYNYYSDYSCSRGYLQFIDQESNSTGSSILICSLCTSKCNIFQ